MSQTPSIPEDGAPLPAPATNYFLADLPPEAELTAGLITEACQTLKRNRRRYLEERSTESLLRLLDGLGREWQSEDFPFRKMALETGPAATGFSAPVLASGLDTFFKQLTAANLEALLCQELGHARRLDDFFAGADESDPRRTALARGPELLAHVAPGNLPVPVLMEMVLGLLARSAQFVKCASRAAFLPGNRPMEGRGARPGVRSFRRSRLRGCDGERRDAGGGAPQGPGRGAFSGPRHAGQFRVCDAGGAGAVPARYSAAGGGGRERLGPAGLPFAACHIY